MLSYRKRPLSIIGIFVFILILVLILFLFYNLSDQRAIKKIEQINAEFGVSNNTLLPIDRTGYVIELNKVESMYAYPIQRFVLLYDDAEKLDRLYNQIYSLNQPCITEKGLDSVENYLSIREAYQNLFKQQYDSKLDKIYWERYMLILDNSSLNLILDNLKELPRC